MDISERFDKAFKAYGGIFPESKRTNRLIYCLESMKRNIEFFQQTANIDIHVYIDYIIEENLQAAVVKDKDYYFIGVSYGGIYVLCDIFMRILSSPNVLISFGDTSKEFTRKIFNAQIKDIITLHLLRGEEEKGEPFDAQRSSIAEFLTVLSTNYLILHEFAHILLGHRDYKLQKHINGESISALFQQCLEYEADAFATNVAVTNLLLRPITIGPEEVVLLPKENNMDKIYLWHFAIYLFWRLYGNNSIDNKANLKSAHPPEIVRQYSIMGLAATIVLGNAEEESIKTNIYNILRDSAIEVEKSLAEISYQSFNLDSYNTMLSQQTKNYYNGMIDVLMKDVMPALKEYRYFDPLTKTFDLERIKKNSKVNL